MVSYQSAEHARHSACGIQSTDSQPNMQGIPGCETDQVAADPGTDETEGQDSELEEFCAAVGGQEAQAAGQNTASERHGC